MATQRAVEGGIYPSVVNRSHFSLLRGCASPEELCFRAAESGERTVGLVDINNFYGLVRFIAAARRMGVKPVSGVAVASPEDPREPLFTLFCIERTGFSLANRVISGLFRSCPGAAGDPRSANTGSGEGLRRTGGRARIQADPEPPAGEEGEPFDPVGHLLEEGWDGCMVVSCRREVLDRLAARDTRELYAGLVYGRPFRDLAHWAAERSVGLFAYNNAVWSTREDRSLYRLLRAIDSNCTVDRLPPGELPSAEMRTVSAAEMGSFFSAVPEALASARRFAAEADGSRFVSDGYVFPAFDGMSEREAFTRLAALCRAGVFRRYGGMRADVKKRLGYELGIIGRKGFSSYFLVVHDIVSRRPRTCGRGSSASSIVSYLLGITHVDPLRYNLFFERFLNMGRKDPPDIDVDFPWDEREKALSYVFERYPGSSGMVADHITFGPRSCIREPAKAFGMEEGEIKRMVSLKRQGGFADIPEYLLRAARRLQGMPRHIGTHPGGVVVTPGPITDYTHVQTSPLGRPVIAWEKDGTEEAGLVKIDLLGNRSLAVMRDCMSIVNPLRKSEGRRPIEWESFDPLSDGTTRRSIESGETLGVFYVESPATRQLLKKMRTGDYEHLVIASSIIRPAANRYIQEYVRRLRGGAYEPIHPSIADTLKETLGIMVYQEDVARVAIDACGFSPEEADLLRKVLTKKDRELRLASCRERFFEGGRGQGLTDDLLEALWDMILSFDGYSFCKAHSASYALVSYRLAWLKRRYPLEFMASVINNGGGFYARQVYVNAVRRMGFPVLGPDVNASALTYTVEAGVPAGKGAGGQALRVGLLQLKGIDQGFLENIHRERGREGAYRDFFDFVCRLQPSPSDMRVLIRSGSLDSVASGFTRPEMFWAFFHRENMRDFFDFPVTPGCLGDYTRGTKLLDEMNTLDLIVSCMPISLFEARVARLVKTRALPPCIDSRVLADYSGTRVCIPGSLVTGKEVRTKKKRNMCFVSFEDRYSLFESVLFPEAWERFADLLDAGTAFLVIGMVEEDFGTHQLRVEDMIPLSRVSGGIDFGGRQRELPAVWRGAYA